MSAASAPSPEESAPRTVLEALVLERLRQTLARCLANPRYARRLGGAAPEDIRSIDDWRGLPFLVNKGTNFYPRQIESLILRRPSVGHEYQILLERRPGGDSLAVIIEAGQEFKQVEAEHLRLDIRAELGLSAEIKVVREGELPRSQGKAVRVVDHRQSRS